MSRTREAESSSQYRSDIQGLRAVAVALVLLYHAGVEQVTGGFVGVDVFFVISGFLITSHLLRSLDVEGRIRFSEFFARRARRILPASFFVLAATVVVSIIVLPPLQLKTMLQGAIATALYVPNVYFGYIGTDYLSDSTPSLFQHYWSLGIEEQFYLLWPLLLGVGFLLFRSSRRSLFILVASLVLLSFVYCIFLTSTNQPWAFFSLPTRAWELGTGGLVAFFLSSEFGRSISNRCGPLGWLGVAGMTAAALLFNDQTSFPGYSAALPVVAAALLIVGGAAPGSSSMRILSARPLVFIGTISYSLYLVHWPVLLLAQAAAGARNPLPLWASLGLVVACVPVAWLLYRFVETPFRNPQWLSEFRPRRSLLLAGAVSAVLALVCGAVIPVVDRVPLEVDATAEEYVAAVAPSGTPYVPSNLNPSLREAKNSLPEISGNGCHLDFEDLSPVGCQYGPANAPTVALFGDSHAEHWFPPLKKLADAGEIHLDTNSKSSCNSVDVISLLNNERYQECDLWREAVIDRLSDNPPDVVILANYAREDDIDDGGKPFASVWEDGLVSTINSLPTQTSVIILGETATMGITPAICLSAHLDDADYCGKPASLAIDRAAVDAERRAAEETGAEFLDLNPYLCNAEWCPPIIGNVLVYSDGHHLTVPFTEGLTDPLQHALQRALDASD